MRDQRCVRSLGAQSTICTLAPNFKENVLSLISHNTVGIEHSSLIHVESREEKNAGVYCLNALIKI